MWVVVAWGVLLLGLAVWSAMRGDATVREQTTVDSAKKTIDSVADRLDSAVPTGWSVVDEGYQEQSCELTLSRDGVEVRRTLAFTGPTGSEPATLSQLASTLDGAVIRPGEGTPESFYYDAGNYVGVRGKVDSSGTIRVALDSGCRAR